MGNVVMFPAHKVKKPKVKQTEEQSKKDKRKYIHRAINRRIYFRPYSCVTRERCYNEASETFLRDLAVIIESIKSLIKRDFGQKHPMQTYNGLQFLK